VKKPSSSTTQHHAKPEVAHLDTALTDVATKSAATLQKWWKPVCGFLGAILVGYGIVQGIGAWKSNQEAAINERIFRLFHSPQARKDGYAVDRAELDRLIADTRGSSLQPLVFQTGVEYFLDKAAKIEAKAKSEEKKAAPPLGGAATTPETTPPANPLQELEEARTQAVQLAAAAAKELPGDSTIVEWSKRVEQKIDGERTKSWLPAKWQFSPPKPGQTPPEANAK
jgi:hypothetical protein